MAENASLADRLARGVTVVDLSQPLEKGIPHSVNHPAFTMALLRRHGDSVREDGTSSANEIIVTGGHVGTHIDALSHVSSQGLLHDGVDAGEAQRTGRFSAHGVERIAPIVARGVLLDVPAALGVEVFEPAHQITAAELEQAELLAGTTLGRGDVALIRTGWARHFGDPDAFLGHASGVPGPDEEAGRWLAQRGILAAGSDTTAFEYIPPGEGHRLLPVHRLLLVEHGIYILEMLDLEEVARIGARVFGFVAAPLKLVGATGSPIRPLALVEA